MSPLAREAAILIYGTVSAYLRAKREGTRDRG